MKEYTFKKIELKGLKGFLSTPKENYHEIIHEYAAKGWELVQIFSPANSMYGSTSYIELIFTRNIEEN